MADSNHKKIYRSKKDMMLAGVCGGIGEYSNVDSTLVRLVFVASIFFGGAGIVFYLLAWLIIPERK